MYFDDGKPESIVGSNVPFGPIAARNRFTLKPPTSEAYTPTLVGPDGTAYAINDEHLYVIGN